MERFSPAESVQKSPKIEVPHVRRSAANMGTTPTEAAAASDSSSSSSSKSTLHGTSSGGGVTKATAQSPAVQKWKSIVKTLTPELIRNGLPATRRSLNLQPFFLAMHDNIEFIIRFGEKIFIRVLLYQYSLIRMLLMRP